MWYVSFYPWVILDIVEESIDKVAANKASSTCHKDCNTTLFPHRSIALRYAATRMGILLTDKGKQLEQQVQ